MKATGETDRQARADAAFGRLKWIVPVNGVVIVLALVTIHAHLHHWRWALFLWGVAVGLIGAAVVAGALLISARRPERTEAARGRIRSRLPTYGILWIESAAMVGGLAAVMDAVWIDIAGAAYAALSLLVGSALLVPAHRRNGGRRGRSVAP